MEQFSAGVAVGGAWVLMVIMVAMLVLAAVINRREGKALRASRDPN